jgi:MarR family transcriptional regulator, transcriptional regulator for hemolysin
VGQHLDSGTAVAERPQPLKGNLCWLLSQAAHGLKTELTAAFEDLGLSPRGHLVISAAMTGAYTQTELARMVGLDKTTMVVTLDELEAAGLAERRPSPHDRRARVIAVTEAGERRLREAEQIGDRLQNDVLSALEPEERRAFMDALSRLVGGRLAEPPLDPSRRRA